MWWSGSPNAHRKVTLQLDLADQYAVRPEFLKKETTYRRFGFDLRESNRLPLDRTLPDYRSDECKAIQYPDPAVMPKVTGCCDWVLWPCAVAVCCGCVPSPRDMR